MRTIAAAQNNGRIWRQSLSLDANWVEMIGPEIENSDPETFDMRIHLLAEAKKQPALFLRILRAEEAVGFESLPVWRDRISLEDWLTGWAA